MSLDHVGNLAVLIIKSFPLVIFNKRGQSADFGCILNVIIIEFENFTYTETLQSTVQVLAV